MKAKQNTAYIPADPGTGNRAEPRVPPVCVKSLNTDSHRLTHDLGQGDGWGIVCCLSGKVRLQVTAGGKINELTILAGRFGLYDCPSGGCRAVLVPVEPTRILYLLISRTVLGVLPSRTSLLGRYASPEGSGQVGFAVHDIAPSMNHVINSIQDVLRYDGDADLLLLAKALEFLGLHFASERLVSGQSLNPQDYRAIQEAGTILRNNLNDPPSLHELAKFIGMSASKLKLLFPKEFGMPPYKYLHKLRMQKALNALTRDGMNVTEAAMEVGYSSISYFAKVFKLEHGILPSEVRRRFLGH